MSTVLSPTLPPPPFKPDIKLVLKNIDQAANHCRNLVNIITPATPGDNATLKHISELIYQLIEQSASRTMDAIELREEYEKKTNA